jgi:hypothetical protein
MERTAVEVTEQLSFIEAGLLEAVDVGDNAETPLHHLIGERISAFALSIALIEVLRIGESGHAGMLARELPL